MVDGIGIWNFKTLSKRSSPKVIDLSEKQQGKIEQYEKALVIASGSKVAKPYISNYFVKEGIVAKFPDGLIIEEPAGNIEYGRNNAIHGEEAATATYRAALSKLGVPHENVEEIVLGIIAGNPGNVPAPCGNCRDVMIDGLGVNNLEIVSGTADGGLAMVVPMDMFMFDPQKEIFLKGKSRKYTRENLEMSKASFIDIVSQTLKEGRRLTNDAYSTPTVKPERKYHATIVTNRGLVHGAFETFVNYRPNYPITDAIRQITRSGDSSSIQSVVVVTEDPNVKPDPMYLERQHLGEFHLSGELVNGIEQDPSVFLVTHDEKDKISKVHKTTIGEWLPNPFTPRNFGPDFLNFLHSYHEGRVK